MENAQLDNKLDELYRAFIRKYENVDECSDYILRNYVKYLSYIN
ncbi:hypothetical protein [Clostridium brassicae]|uniref:Uncharacterized protein n=1 Tax=Clostridium brassicae TaxID=2999072 RepID=A0ABT4DAY0_9CLOT|nr:hypothetical protein [Clostridium brassicae]MCY6958291.1 hypothetical protein [Clostridium brassicae]